MRALPLALVAAVACAGTPRAATAPDVPLPSRETALRTRGAPARGPADALVTLVEFSDFECPYCANAAELVEVLRARFPEDLRVVFRHFPLSFHEDARPAHEAAVEVRAQGGDDAFWAFHDRVYATRDLSLEGLGAAAEAAGVSAARVRDAVAREVHAGTVDEDLAAGVSLGVNGTPTFLLNGRLVLGAPPPEEFVALIDATRSEAAALVASGVPRAEVSARITDALGGPPPEPELRAPLTIPPTAPRQGPADAPVAVHVFRDHPCVGCGAVTADLARLRRAFGDDVQIVHRSFPLSIHPGARRAAEALLAVHSAGGEDARAAFEAALLSASPALDADALGAMASRIGAGLGDAVTEALADRRHRAAVEADRREAERVGLRITPSFVVGRRVLAFGAGFRELEEAADLMLEADGL